MVEAPTAERAEAVARDLAGVVEHRLALMRRRPRPL
jgi:hypothetical protein